MKKLNFKPVIIIGAARSGTNMLRDVLTSIDEFSTWPCDEINYIWRYGNREREDDEFTINDVNSKNKTYIRKQFMKLYKKYNTDYIIEKTCANSLRVDYVNEIIPEAKYIHIYRDPVDVSASAKKRWKSSLDILYTLKKARYVPLRDIPFYAFKYLKNRSKRFFNDENRLDYWGPKFKNFRNIIKNKNLTEISAIQWKKSVENAIESFNKISTDKVFHISYENFVQNPEEKLIEITNFIDNDIRLENLNNYIKEVSTSSIGKGYNNFSKNEIEIIKNITDSVYSKIKN